MLRVLEDVLAKQEWLVGGKATIADLSFIPWNYFAVITIVDSLDFDAEFPATAAWHKKLVGRPAVKKVCYQRRASCMSSEY